MEWPSLAPIGYLNNPRTRNIQPDPEKAPMVRKAFELYSTAEHTLYTLADALKHIGLTSYSGKPLAVSSVQVLLQNPIYYGARSTSFPSSDSSTALSAAVRSRRNCKKATTTIGAHTSEGPALSASICEKSRCLSRSERLSNSSHCPRCGARRCLRSSTERK